MGGTEMNEPKFIYRDGMLADNDYVQWLKDLKARYRQCQAKAAVKVNTAMLEFYWSLGRDIIQLKAESKWGSGFFNQLSLDMRAMFPNEKGFSVTNLKYMKRWYLFYFEKVINRQPPVGQIGHQAGDEIRQQPADEIQNQIQAIRHQAGDEFEMPPQFGIVPWKHHVYIFTKSQSLEEALFYINKVASEGWSRLYLEQQVDEQLYQVQGAAITNFESTLPSPQSKLVQEILKDPYNLSFLTMKAKYDEHELEEALVANVTQFLLELGKGFSYVGRQMELKMPGGQTFFPDLVFYFIPQHRYIIIELKAVKYIPEFAGKLNFYVTAADELLRGEGDNPSVGLIICKSKDKTVVEWSLKDINKPLGVATYQLQEVVDRTVAELELKKKQMKEDGE